MPMHACCTPWLAWLAGGMRLGGMAGWWQCAPHAALGALKLSLQQKKSIIRLSVANQQASGSKLDGIAHAVACRECAS